MTVKIRPYRGQEGVYEVDIKIELPDGTEIRERKKSPCRGKEDSKRWAAEREHGLQQLARSGELKRSKEIPTMEAFWPRFVDGVMKARKLEASTIRVKTSHFRTWILPHVKRNLYEGVLKPYCKNKKTRAFKATPRTLAALQSLSKKREDFVFVAEGGGPWSTSTVNRLLSKVFARAEMEKKGPHAFRHCGTTRMGVADVPPAIMLKITGHKHLGILQRYLHPDTEDTSIAVRCLANLAPIALGEVLEKGKPGAVASLAQRRRRRVQEGQ